MLQVFSARICPFAQRVRALLTHLGVDVRVHEVDLSDRDPELVALSPTGRVPLLLDGELKLYESAVILEYLAERHGLTGGLDEDIGVRARERLAMRRWDDAVKPAFYRSLRAGGELEKKDEPLVERELDELFDTVYLMRDRHPSLLALCCAPFWARMDWLRQHSELPALVDRRGALRTWLDAAVGMPAIQDTLPPKEETVRAYRERFVES